MHTQEDINMNRVSLQVVTCVAGRVRDERAEIVRERTWASSPEGVAARMN
jgi:hypothetical protein